MFKQIIALQTGGHFPQLFVDASLRQASYDSHHLSMQKKFPSAEDLQWQTGSMQVPVGSPGFLDRRTSSEGPALAVANSGGYIHMGAIVLSGSNVVQPPAGVFIGSVAEAFDRFPQCAQRLQHRAFKRKQTAQTALTSAFQNCGVFVHIAANTHVYNPIQLIWLYPKGHNLAVFPQIYVFLENGATATIMERHLGEGDGWLCGVVEAEVNADAKLHYVSVTQADELAIAAMQRSSHCNENGLISWCIADLGGDAIESATNTTLHGRDAQMNYAAMFLNDRTRSWNSHTRISRPGARTQAKSIVRAVLVQETIASIRSFLNTKTPLKESSFAIEPKRFDNQQASEDCRILLRSPKAQIRLRPWHKGQKNSSLIQTTTVGSVDDEALFYAATRGLSATLAMRMITIAFFEPVILQLFDEAIREEIRTALDERIDRIYSDV